VAKNKKQYKELCLGMSQISTKQGAIYEKGKRTTSIGNVKRTMAGN